MKRKFITIAAMICVLGGLTACGNSDIEALKKDVEELKSQVAALSAASSSDQTAENDVQTVAPESSDDAAYTLSAGDYEVPGDIAEGKYDVVCVSGDGIFKVDTGDVLSNINEAMNIPGAEGNNYPNAIQKRSNTTLSNGYKVTISEDLVVQLIKK